MAIISGGKYALPEIPKSANTFAATRSVILGLAPFYSLCVGLGIVVFGSITLLTGQDMRATVALIVSCGIIWTAVFAGLITVFVIEATSFSTYSARTGKIVSDDIHNTVFTGTFIVFVAAGVVSNIFLLTRALNP